MGSLSALTILDGILSLTSSILSSGLIDRISCEIGEEFASEMIKIRLQLAKESNENRRDGTNMTDIEGIRTRRYIQGDMVI